MVENRWALRTGHSPATQAKTLGRWKRTLSSLPPMGKLGVDLWAQALHRATDVLNLAVFVRLTAGRSVIFGFFPKR